MRYLLIDGNNLVYRTWWTAKNQQKIHNKTDTQKDTDQIMFTLNAILSYTRKYNPTKVYISWDERQGNADNSRKLIDENYKGTRDNNIEPHQNNDTIKELLYAIGINSIYPYNLEADDVIAYMCHTLPGEKAIISVDKDFLQLISPTVKVFDPIRKVEYNYDNFKSLTGFTQDDWYKAKCAGGDKSDNVPGIKGWGKVTIARYIAGDIEPTEEQQSIIDHNHKVFSLNIYKDSEDELNFYNTQIKEDVTGDFSLFKRLMGDIGINNVKSEWNTLFITNRVLMDIFS